MFDPRVGRWLSDDPIRWDAGDVNLQRYVGNNPTNSTDPSGLAEESAAKAGVGVARSLGVSGVAKSPEDAAGVARVPNEPPRQKTAWNWTEETARARIRQQIQEWRAMRCDFAADLMEYFLSAKEKPNYQPTPANIEEAYSNSDWMIRRLIVEAFNRGTAHNTGGRPTSMGIVVKKEPVRWDIYRGGSGGPPVPSWGRNRHLFFAYGGARISVTGTVYLRPGGTHDADVTVTIEDDWDFNEETFGMRGLLFDSYDATRFLQLERGYKRFSHTLTFKKYYEDIFRMAPAMVDR
jgi:hypothetical protein